MEIPLYPLVQCTRLSCRVRFYRGYFAPPCPFYTFLTMCTCCVVVLVTCRCDKSLCLSVRLRTDGPILYQLQVFLNTVQSGRLGSHKQHLNFKQFETFKLKKV